jgi:integrase
MRPKHIRRVIDRKGGVRFYYVRVSGPHIRLPDDEGSPAFLQAYEEARRVKTLRGRLARQPARPRRCVRDLVELYLRSAEYARLAPQTQRVYARVLRRLCEVEDMAGCSIAALDRRRLRRHIHRNAPAAAADLLKKLRALMRCAIAHVWRADDPTRGIKVPPEGHHRPWTTTEIAAFEARWPEGTLQHAAFTLLRQTGRRGADIVRMTWADIDRLGRSSELDRALAPWPRTHPHVLPTRAATAFTPHGFGNLMHAAIAATCLPPTCTPDGLRRSFARLVESLHGR